MIGLLTYLPTTAYFPQYFFLLAFLYALVRDREKLLKDFYGFRNDSKHSINWNFLIIALIIFFSSLNRIIHWDSARELTDFFPYFVLLVPTYVLAITFKRSDAKVLIGLIVLEALVVIAEWTTGVSTFDRSLEGFSAFAADELAYFQRPLGLSESSSHIASKLFLAWLLLDFFKLKEKIWLVAKVIIFLGVFMTFNRSVILALGIYLVISQGMSFLTLRYKLENAWIAFVSFGIGLIGFVGVVLFKGQELINQFTRNKGTIELTGREYIWADFIKFIQENLIYGNHSIKLWLDGYHAHNAYIELIATNGIFIAALYFLLIYRNMKSSNWMFVLPILIFGLTQYAFFWGISLFDIVFWVILFQVPAIFSEKKEQLVP